MSYLGLKLKTRDDWEKRFPKVSRARAIQGVAGAILLFGLVVLSSALLARVLQAYQGQPAPGRLWYVLLPTIAAVMFAIIAVVQTASAFSHAPPATREDRDAMATVLWAAAREMVKLAVAFGILLPALLILLPILFRR